MMGLRGLVLIFILIGGVSWWFSLSSAVQKHIAVTSMRGRQVFPLACLPMPSVFFSRVFLVCVRCKRMGGIMLLLCLKARKWLAMRMLGCLAVSQWQVD